MRFFCYDEPRFYFFGLKAGLWNMARNGFELGAKKTVGKITQPINWYARFPEYHYFDAAIRSNPRMRRSGESMRILDVGSPKMLGLMLATTTSAEVTMTDISDLNVEEYRVMWNGLEAEARGHAIFALADARALRFKDAEFDAVYSMSVVEHIDGEGGDTQGVLEMIRVLKPGGVFCVSVPLGPTYLEQQRIGLADAVRPTNDDRAYFFQRIYDRASAEKQLIEPARALLDDIQVTSIDRHHGWVIRAFSALPESVRGVLGFLHPLLSRLANRSHVGVSGASFATYGKTYQARDIYGDLIIVGHKRGYRS